MKMIYNQSFTISQYSAWLARNLALFKALERHAEAEVLRPVHDPKLLRATALEADLAQLGGANWRSKAEEAVKSSSATARYLEHLEADSAHPLLLLAHHFLQYNAVLSGGAYLGEMVSQKLCLPHGTPGVKFYAFDGVEKAKGPARVQQYLREFDTVDIGEPDLNGMLIAMRRIYADTEAMMDEVFELNPAEGVSYGAAKDGVNAVHAPAPIPEADQLELTLAELHGYTGADGGRILFSLAGELLDVSAGREMYGPNGGYALLAGRDVTRCLATMSLEPSDLDDLKWEPDNGEDENALNQWREKLKAKYPVAGRLKPVAASDSATQGLRQRAAAAPTPAVAVSTAAAPSSGQDTQKCPISGKEGAGCPMAAIMGIGKGPAAAQQAGAAKQGTDTAAKPAGTSGFMAGKSLIASVEKNNGNEESFLYRLCPLHWDEQTIKVLAFVAAISWTSGVLVGWNLHRQLMP